MADGEQKLVKARKPYVITKQRERWSEDEHQRFLEALRLHGRAWRKIEEFIGTKTAVQIRSHAQKFFSKLEKQKEAGGSMGMAADMSIEIPPPRPKKKPSRPYPRKDPSAPSAGATGGSHNRRRAASGARQYQDLTDEDEGDGREEDDMGEEGCQLAMPGMECGPMMVGGMLVSGDGCNLTSTTATVAAAPGAAATTEMCEEMSENQFSVGLAGLQPHMVLHPGGGISIRQPNGYHLGAAGPGMGDYLGSLAGLQAMSANAHAHLGYHHQAAAGMGMPAEGLVAPQALRAPAGATGMLNMCAAAAGDGELAGGMQRLGSTSKPAHAAHVAHGAHATQPRNAPVLSEGQDEDMDGEVSEVTVAAVAAAASAAAAAAAAAVVAAAGHQVQAHLQANPPKGFPFFGLPPTTLAQLSMGQGSLEAALPHNLALPHAPPPQPQPQPQLMAQPAQQPPQQPPQTGDNPLLPSQQQLLSLLLGYAHQSGQREAMANSASRQWAAAAAAAAAGAGTRPQTGGGSSYDETVVTNLDSLKPADTQQHLLAGLHPSNPQVPMFTIAQGPAGPVVLINPQAASLAMYNPSAAQHSVPPASDSPADGSLQAQGHHSSHTDQALPPLRPGGVDQHSSDGVSACSRETHDGGVRGRPPVGAPSVAGLAGSHIAAAGSAGVPAAASALHKRKAATPGEGPPGHPAAQPAGSYNPPQLDAAPANKKRKAVNSASAAGGDAPAAAAAAAAAPGVPAEEASVAVLRPQPRRYAGPLLAVGSSHAAQHTQQQQQQPTLPSITRHASSVWSTPADGHRVGPGKGMASGVGRGPAMHAHAPAGHSARWGSGALPQDKQSAAQWHERVAREHSAAQAALAVEDDVGEDERCRSPGAMSEGQGSSSDEEGEDLRASMPPSKAQQAWLMQAGRGCSPCTSDNVGALTMEDAGRHAHAAAHVAAGDGPGPARHAHKAGSGSGSGERGGPSAEGQGTTPATDDAPLPIGGDATDAMQSNTDVGGGNADGAGVGDCGSQDTIATHSTRGTRKEPGAQQQQQAQGVAGGSQGKPHTPLLSSHAGGKLARQQHHIQGGVPLNGTRNGAFGLLPPGHEAQGSNMLMAGANGSSQGVPQGHGSNENGISNGDHSQHMPNASSGNGSGDIVGGAHASSGDGSGNPAQGGPRGSNGNGHGSGHGSDGFHDTLLQPGTNGSNDPNDPAHGSDGTGTNGSDGNNGSHGKGKASNTMCYDSSGNGASRAAGPKAHAHHHAHTTQAPRAGAAGGRDRDRADATAAGGRAHLHTSSSQHATSHHHHHNGNPNLASSRPPHARGTTPRGHTQAHSHASQHATGTTAGGSERHAATTVALPDGAAGKRAASSGHAPAVSAGMPPLSSPGAAAAAAGQTPPAAHLGAAGTPAGPTNTTPGAAAAAASLLALNDGTLRIAPLLGVNGTRAAAAIPPAGFALQAAGGAASAPALQMGLAPATDSQLQVLLASLSAASHAGALPAGFPAHLALPQAAAPHAALQQLARLGLMPAAAPAHMGMAVAAGSPQLHPAAAMQLAGLAGRPAGVPVSELAGLQLPVGIPDLQHLQQLFGGAYPPGLAVAHTPAELLHAAGHGLAGSGAAPQPRLAAAGGSGDVGVLLTGRTSKPLGVALSPSGPTSSWGAQAAAAAGGAGASRGPKRRHAEADEQLCNAGEKEAAEGLKHLRAGGK